MADTHDTNKNTVIEQGTEGEHKQPLPLPPTPDHFNGANDSVKQLNSNGGSISFYHLGPIVVNIDGTMSRVANWPNMTPIERENTIRILGKRNRLRLMELRKSTGETEKAGDSGAET